MKIQFRSDGTYTFYDSDSLGNDKTYNGTFTLNDTLVVISKENNVTEKFSFKQGDKGDSNFYLKNEVHYMVKSETYSEISWEEMQKKILEAQYKSMAQTHYKGFTLITNNEMTYFTFQPEIDAYQKVLEKCKTCPKVPVASE